MSHSIGRCWGRYSSALAIATIAGAGGGTASAAVASWDDGGQAGVPAAGGTYWEDAANWSGNVVPPVLADIEIGTGFASGKRIYLSSNKVVNSLTFRNAPHLTRLTWSFGGPFKIYLYSGALTRTSTSSGEQRIDDPIFLLNPGKFTISGVAGERVRIDGDIDSNEFTGFLVAGLVKDGSGELALYGNNTWDGMTLVKNGRLVLGSNGALPGTTTLWTESTLSQHPEVVLNASVATTVNAVLLDDGAKMSGASTSSLAAGQVIMLGKSELAVRLIGAADVAVYSDADAKISTSGTYTGEVQIHDLATLTVNGQGALGASTNRVVFGESGRLVLDNSHDLDHSRVFVVDGVTAKLEGAFDIGAQFEGDGLVEIFADYHDIYLHGSRTAFTGRIALDGDSGAELALGTSSLGHATQVFLNGAGDVLHLSGDNPALDAPTLSMSDDCRLEMNNHDATFGALQVGSNEVSISLVKDTTHGVLHLSSISLNTASTNAKLHIAGWSGMVGGSGTDDRIFVATTPPGAVLAKIVFDGTISNGATVLSTGELVPRIP